MYNTPEGVDLDVRNPCLEEEDIGERESLSYEQWREEREAYRTWKEKEYE